MRDEVKLLVEQYAAGADERRQREEREREQRRLKRQEEQQRRQDELDREAVRRAEMLEAAGPVGQATNSGDGVSLATHYDGAGRMGDPAGPVVLSVLGAASANAQDASQDKVREMSIKGAANGQRVKPKSPSFQAMMELSDDQSSTQGSPRKAPAGSSRDAASIARLDQFATPTSPTLAKLAAPQPRQSSFEPVHRQHAEPTFFSPDDDTVLSSLANGVNHDATGYQEIAARAGGAGTSRLETGKLEPPVADDADSSNGSEAEGSVAEPPRRKVDHGRAEPAQPAEAEIAPPQRSRNADRGSPELAVPAANQQQQQREEVRTATIAGQKRTTRSSTRGSSSHGPTHSSNGQSDSERPTKRMKSGGSVGGSARTSRAASRASSPAQAAAAVADGVGAEDEEPASLAKNVGKKSRGRPTARDRGRDKPKKPAIDAQSATQLGEMTLESDDDDE